MRRSPGHTPQEDDPEDDSKLGLPLLGGQSLLRGGTFKGQSAPDLQMSASSVPEVCCQQAHRRPAQGTSGHQQ